MSRAIHRFASASVVVAVLAGVVLFAQRGGGGASRGAARTSVNRSAGQVDRNVGSSANRSVNSNVNRNVNGNVNRNVNSNVDRNVNANGNVDVDRNIDYDRDVDVDVDHYGGWGGCCYRPGAGAVAATAAAVTTAAVVGSVVHSVPPSCAAVSVNGLTYQQCGSTWYQPQFSGSSVTYIVVNPPN